MPRNTPLDNLWNVGDGVKEYGDGGTQACAVTAKLVVEEILTLARWACAVEEHYSKHHGAPTPMDMEWAKDGVSGELFLPVDDIYAQSGQIVQDPPDGRVHRVDEVAGELPEPQLVQRRFESVHRGEVVGEVRVIDG